MPGISAFLCGPVLVVRVGLSLGDETIVLDVLLTIFGGGEVTVLAVLKARAGDAVGPFPTIPDPSLARVGLVVGTAFDGAAGLALTVPDGRRVGALTGTSDFLVATMGLLLATTVSGFDSTDLAVVVVAVDFVTGSGEPLVFFCDKTE